MRATGSQIARPRARDLGLAPGILPTGPLNAIADVAGVRVGHITLHEGSDIRTGVTAILPHAGNIFQEKVPAGLAVGNGFGKLAGATQLVELGEIETPIVLTNTLAVPRAADAILDWTLAQPGNETSTSVNPVVGETNDSTLNDIRRRVVTREHVLAAIETAQAGPIAEGIPPLEGCIGAGTGTVAFGWKGGIGTSSRRLPVSSGCRLSARLDGYTVGVLVQSNFSGVLQIMGIPVGERLGRYYLKDKIEKEKPTGRPNPRSAIRNPQSPDGSIMIVLATDAPLSDRNLTRLARRAMAGLARTGAAMSNGSGDYAIAFSTSELVRRTPLRRSNLAHLTELPNDALSPLFLAAIEATEGAIYNSLLKAETTTGYRGRTVEALPLPGEWMSG